MLATLAVNGEVYVHKSGLVGKWSVVASISKTLYSHLKSNDWLLSDQSCDKDNTATKKKRDHVVASNMREYIRRKHMLFFTSMCWCPITWRCGVCLQNRFPENVYYTSYLLSYARCVHTNAMLCTVNRSGTLFIWLLTFEDDERSVGERKCGTKLSYSYETGLGWPVSLAWHQDDSNNGW